MAPAAAEVAAPAAVTAADASCPTMVPSTALSQATQGLFELIANACRLKSAGLIEDYQFQAIRDQAVNDILVQMQADANGRINASLAVVP